jgi:hypothetical protein
MKASKTSINQGPLIQLIAAKPCTIEKVFEMICHELKCLREDIDGIEQSQSAYTLAEVLEYAKQLRPYTGNGWLEKVSHACEMFNFHKTHLPQYRARSAEEIGKIIAEQLMANNRRILQIVSDGLLRLDEKKSFNPDIKMPDDSWKARLTVALTFFYLRHTGVSNPSQTEVRLKLSQEGHRFSKKTISVYFDELGLNQYASDARKAASDAGRRRRTRGKLPRD